MKLYLIIIRTLFFLSFIIVPTIVSATPLNSYRIHRLRALTPPRRCSRRSCSALPKAAATNAAQVAAQQARALSSSDYSTTLACARRPLAAFIAVERGCDNQQRNNIHEPTSVRLSLNRPKKVASTTMIENIDTQLLVAHNISSILLSSVQSVDSTNQVFDLPKSIQDATLQLHNLQSRASSLCGKECTSVHDFMNSSHTFNNEHRVPLQLLSDNAIAAVDSLRLLIHHVNQSPRKGKKSRKGAKQSSGRAWSALESLITDSLGFDSFNVLDANCQNINVETSDLAITLAVLAMGLALAINSTDLAITKMIASAVLPSDEIHRGKNYQKIVSSMTGPVRIHVHSMARSAVLGLLRLANQNARGSSDDTIDTVDMQIVAKIESGFCVGSFGRSLNDGTGDAELAKVTADVVNNILKVGRNGGDVYSNGDGGASTISKDVLVPTLSIIANFRPWNCVDVEKLARIAGEMDLWYSVEILCDAIIDTYPTTTAKKSTAQLTAQAIVDIAFDHRLYRRADALATKYYSYVGPERYAEARFMHACDTIEKVIKKRQVQIIEKQVERVDEVALKVNSDLALLDDLKAAKFQGEDITIQTMSDHIREFSLRRLRASNQHTTAARLANLWGMKYSRDPMQMMEELEKRKFLYFQWNDDCCPGSSCHNHTSGNLPLPQLISTPSDLLEQFAILKGTIGFDCEWHDSINHVALLQLSSTTNTLLLDIPALTMTKEGCDALRLTVGALFSRRSNGPSVIGFSCKDDIKRLRASPCVPTSTHWFPLKDRELNISDLRHLAAEIVPRLDNGRGLLNLGLSRLCEVFLGKQLDKAEQCSDWLIRPLSPEQIEYAALDAWGCAAIYAKIQEMNTSATQSSDHLSEYN